MLLLEVIWLPAQPAAFRHCLAYAARCSRCVGNYMASYYGSASAFGPSDKDAQRSASASGPSDKDAQKSASASRPSDKDPQKLYGFRHNLQRSITASRTRRAVAVVFETIWLPTMGRHRHLGRATKTREVGIGIWAERQRRADASSIKVFAVV